MHVDRVAYDGDVERLVQPRREAPPLELLQAAVDPRHDPHVPLERDDRRAPVAEEVDVGGAHVPAPRVRERQREMVDDVVRAVGRRLAARAHDPRPVRGPTTLGVRHPHRFAHERA